MFLLTAEDTEGTENKQGEASENKSGFIAFFRLRWSIKN